LELAKELGATHTINSTKEDPVEKIKEITGSGANYSFETTGVNTVTLQAIRCLKVKGTMATVAVGKKDLTLNVTNEIVIKAITSKVSLKGMLCLNYLSQNWLTFIKKACSRLINL